MEFDLHSKHICKVCPHTDDIRSNIQPKLDRKSHRHPAERYSLKSNYSLGYKLKTNVQEARFKGSV